LQSFVHRRCQICTLIIHGKPTCTLFICRHGQPITTSCVSFCLEKYKTYQPILMRLTQGKFAYLPHIISTIVYLARISWALVICHVLGWLFDCLPLFFFLLISYYYFFNRTSLSQDICTPVLRGPNGFSSWADSHASAAPHVILTNQLPPDTPLARLLQQDGPTCHSHSRRVAAGRGTRPGRVRLVSPPAGPTGKIRRVRGAESHTDTLARPPPVVCVGAVHGAIYY
jgi:hypothetical protein